MASYFVAISAVVLPLLLTVFLRVHAGIQFFIFSGSYLMVHFLDINVLDFISMIIPGTDAFVVRVFIIGFPILVGGLMFRHTITKRMLPLHVLLSLINGVVLFSYIVPYLTPQLALQVREGIVYQRVEPFFSLAVAIAFLWVFLLWWRQLPKYKDEHHN